MRLTRACKPQLPEPRDTSGIALFMVMSAIGVLSILVTEFAYIAQINERIAYDSLDQVKAHYLAKSGVKLSLLRLKAYAQLKSMAGGGKGNSNPASNPISSIMSAIPQSVLDKIWSFPFMYPLPALPNMTVGQQDQIKEFEKASDLDGKFSAVIESESSRYDLNSILPGFGASPSPSPSPSNSPGSTTSQTPTAPPSQNPGNNSEMARKGLHDYIQNLMASKALNDPDFQRDYQDFRIDDLMDYITQWADHSFLGTLQYPSDAIQPKHAPFYSLTELHQIPTMDDELYNLFADGLTVSPTNGININTMQETVLRAIVPQMTNDDVTNFFQFRDDPTVDNTFKSASDFFDYLTKNVAAFRSDPDAIKQLQQTLQQENIQLITNEMNFKITVRAQVNQAVRTFELWVTVTGPGQIVLPNPMASANPASASQFQVPNPQNSAVPDTGLKINFVRVL